jgi:hypothetical protein
MDLTTDSMDLMTNSMDLTTDSMDLMRNSMDLTTNSVELSAAIADACKEEGVKAPRTTVAISHLDAPLLKLAHAYSLAG